MNIYYDFEFIESGRASPLLPLSLGMVRDDGAELHWINRDPDVISLAIQHPWLRQNVIPHLPLHVDTFRRWNWNLSHPDYAHVRSRRTITDAVRDFICELKDPQLWGWYCAYDHVLLAQLFGRMTDLPEGVPMYSNDLRQECRGDQLPPMPGAQQHNALSDAREIRYRYHWYMDSNWDFCPCSPDSATQCELI